MISRFMLFTALYICINIKTKIDFSRKKRKKSQNLSLLFWKTVLIPTRVSLDHWDIASLVKRGTSHHPGSGSVCEIIAIKILHFYSPK